MLIMLVIRCSLEFHADITTYRMKQLRSQVSESVLQIIVLKLDLGPVQEQEQEVKAWAREPRELGDGEPTN